MKQTFNSILISSLQAVIVCVAMLPLLVACQKDSDGILPEDRPAQELTIATHVTGFMPEDSVADTRASISGNTFSFTAGDAIGLIGLKNGIVMSEYNNIKLTYSGGGRWRSSSTLYDFGATSYIAYYPYSSNMSDKSSIDAIKNAFTIKNDQSSEAYFNASLLLTATATINGGMLKFNFTPAFAMVEVVVPNEVKGYSNANGEDYTYKIHAGSWAPTFSHKFYQVSNKTYRRIIQPSTNIEIEVQYNADYGYNIAKYTKTVNISAGNYKKLTLNETIKRNIKVGDCVYASGSEIVFIPDYDPNTLGLGGSGILGVVAYVGNVFEWKDGYTHGMVMASKDAATNVSWYNACSMAPQHTPAAPKPATTGWYLPGRFELQYLFSGIKNNIGLELAKTLNSNIYTPWGTDLTEGVDKYMFYWSSDPISDTDAYYVAQKTATIDYRAKRNDANNFARPVFRF